jgi:CDGSH-type Zn-finger protein
MPEMIGGDMPKPEMAKIVVSENGPYVVSGKVPIHLQTIVPNSEGLSWEWKEGREFKAPATYALCRCGHSKNKPFCDGSHVRVGFDGKETATRQPYERQAESIEGPGRVLLDAEELCAFARFCDVGGKIWSLVDQTDDPATRNLVDREAAHCPGGRLVVLDGKGRKPLEPTLPPSIGIVEDPPTQCSGPLWVRGGIRIESANGTPYEIRNRVALCRCGASVNKPFCNGSHASIRFQDGLG